MLNKKENSNAIDKFNIKEYAIESLFNRHIFNDITNGKVDFDTSKELYKSHFLHSQNLIKYYNSTFNNKGKNTIEGYCNEVHTDEIIFDIDNDDLEKAKADAIKFLQVLSNNYEVELSHLQINFSGNKGFHIRIPAVLFGDFNPSLNLCNHIKSLAVKLTQGTIEIDTSIYDRSRLVRVPNTINGKSNLYSIPLTYNEVFTKSIADIKSLARSSRDFAVIENDELAPVQGLVDLKNKILTNGHGNTKNSTPQNVFNPKTPGNRHGALTSIIGRLMKAGLGPDDIHNIAQMWNKSNLPPKTNDEVSKTVDDLIDRYGSEKGLFWVVENNKIKIVMIEYLNFLNELGIKKVYYGKSFLWVLVKNNIAEVLIPAQIGDHVQGYLNNNQQLQTEEVLEELLEKVRKYFGEKLLERVKTIELNMSSESKDIAHIHFKNSFAIIKKGQSLELKKYTELENPIWKSQIIDRTFEPQLIKRQQSEFEIFLWNVSGNNTERFLAICSAMGYLLHGFKNKSTAKAIVAVDEKISSDPNGRTGKSLVAKALSYMKTTKRIDGKNFSFNPRFTFQEISPNTDLIDFNDVKSDFDFEKLFSVLTDDMTVEYKSQHPFTLKFEDSPKIYISTNYTIPGNGDSYKDRMFEIEFSDYYTAKKKPVDEFGHLFFDDWNDKEWNRFDNFMIECLQLYLDEGLVECKMKNLSIRKILDRTSQEFVDFAEYNIQPNEEYDKEILFQSFKNFFGYEVDIFGKCPVKKNTFTRWLKSYGDHINRTYEERRSSGNYFFRYV